MRICCIDSPAAIVTSTKGRLSARASSAGASSSSISAIIWGFTPRKMKSQMLATSSFVPQAQPSSSANACALAGVRLASSTSPAPALLQTARATAPPILPQPIKPYFIKNPLYLILYTV